MPKHERHILQNKPTRTGSSALNETKHLFDQARPCPVDTDIGTNEREILTRKPPDQSVAARQASQLADIVDQGDFGEVTAQHNLGRWVDLAQQLGLEPSIGEPPFEPPDTSEKTNDSHSCLLAPCDYTVV
jgi:hypothetical protein